MVLVTWVGRAAAVAGGMLAAVGCGTAVLLLVAARVPEPPVFLGSGVAAGLGAWVLVWRLLRRSPALGSRAVGAAGALAVAALLGSSLIPLGDRAVPAPVPPGHGTWSMAGGGVLAHGVVRAPEGLPDRSPIVVVHGGPGVADTAGLLHAFGPLAELGYDVWAYDQRGTGRSSRLSDPAGYTAALDVADLEEVIDQVTAERVVLVGHSYGAYLAAAYIAEHPQRVERAVFLSPGDLDPGRAAGDVQQRLTPAQRWTVYRLLVGPRALLAYGLVQVNPAAAHAFLGDREADARQDRVYAASVPGLHCPGRTGPALHGLGFYANVVPGSRRLPAPDLTAHLGQPSVPALVVKGQCDYLDWESGTGYLTAFPDSTLLYLRGAGHDVHIDEPEQIRAALADFLSGRPVAGSMEGPLPEPADYQP
jgi:proline iminopeptidase